VARGGAGARSRRTRDGGDAAAYDETAALVEGFATTLSPDRGARLVAAPAIRELLTLAGRTAAV
jgi:hypothetical protein